MPAKTGPSSPQNSGGCLAKVEAVRRCAGRLQSHASVLVTSSVLVVASLLLVAMPFVTSSFLLLILVDIFFLAPGWKAEKADVLCCRKGHSGISFQLLGGVRMRGS